ncbi:TIGR02206 family membrane protein [Arthrobacter citreus]|nr:TIGR02206 family membrane protein [Arthrobacter citreus]
MYLCCYTLITKNYKIYDIIYFWGLAGAIQSVITPDMKYAFPHFKYIQFFITHGGIILSICYMTYIFGYTPTFRSLIKSFLYLIMLAIPIYLLDYFIKGNYLFLRAKLPGANLLDFFGPWPYYLIVLGLLQIPYFLILYSPIHLINNKKKNNHNSAHLIK